MTFIVTNAQFEYDTPIHTSLCDQCGANLNVTTCSCRKESLYRNPFQALAERMEEIIPTEDQEV